MKERPILFSGLMVRAILSGRKTQTRRPVKPQPRGLVRDKTASMASIFHWPHGKPQEIVCPYGVPGDRLRVRETSIITPKHWDDGGTFTHRDPDGDKRWIQYIATSPDCEAAKDYGLKITPSIFMPRWASRITLEITEVRVQQIWDISAGDCFSEGIVQSNPEIPKDPQIDFRNLWDSINAKRGFGWDQNPWVWAITFRRVSQ